MLRLIALDAGPLGVLTHPKKSPENEECVYWLQGLLSQGMRVVIAEITDYELRREYLLTGRTNALAKLDALIETVEYLPLDTSAIRVAAQLWAQVRKMGITTADRHALDADCIMASQVLLATGQFGISRTETITATVDVGDLNRLATIDLGTFGQPALADTWRNIIS